MSKIHVATFMKAGERFVPVEEFNGPLKDEFYVEGALELSINGVMISCMKYWDLIDQLWDYILQGVEKLRADAEFETYWPDQPIKLVMTPLPMGVVRVERSGSSDPDAKVVVDKEELIQALLAGASAFFSAFARWSRDFDPEKTRDAIDRLRQG